MYIFVQEFNHTFYLKDTEHKRNAQIKTIPVG